MNKILAIFLREYLERVRRRSFFIGLILVPLLMGAVIILPMYLAGTHDAFPKGAYMLKNREIAAHIGPFCAGVKLLELGAGRSRSATYRRVANHLERIVRSMAPVQYRWTLGEAGLSPYAEWQAERDRADGDEQEEDNS